MLTFKLHIDVVKTINTSKQRNFIFFFFNYINTTRVQVCIDDQNVQRIITRIFGLFINMFILVKIV